MAVSPFDSALYGGLLRNDAVARLFSDSAELRAMLLVEGTLAQVQGALGLIPVESAEAIRRASHELQVDPGGLAGATAENAVPVPALVAAFRSLMQAPEHAQYVHWGATSQDIMDTGLMLRLRQAVTLIEADLTAVLGGLAGLAETHADVPMAGRTYGQVATPTSFGAVVAEWGRPLLAARSDVAGLRERVLVVSLSGAAGTLGAMGPEGPEVRTALAGALGLGDPGASWHSDRSRITQLAGWLAQLSGSLGKMGEDLLLMRQSGQSEVTLSTSGASSTMPNKQNPVGPSVLVALARHAAGLNGTLGQALVHRQQRDASAWILEWLTLPELVVATARALATARQVLSGLAPDIAALRHNLEDPAAMPEAEGLSFALGAVLPRPDAQAQVKRLCRQAIETGTPLRTLAERAYPDLDLAAVFDPETSLGTAPEDARAFARAVQDG